MNISSSSLISLILVPLLTVWPVLADSSHAVGGADALQVRASAVEGQDHSIRSFLIQVTDDTGAGVADAAVLLRLPEAGPSGLFADGGHSAVAYTDAAGQVQISGIRWSAEAGVVAVGVTVTKGAAHAETLLQQPIGAAVPAAVVAVPTPAPVPAQAKEPVHEAQAETVQPGVPVTTTPHVALPPALSTAPSVSVVNAPTHEKFAAHTSSSHTKWFILAAVIAAGAGAGVAMMGKKSSSGSSAAPPTTVTVGQPTVSVGAP